MLQVLAECQENRTFTARESTTSVANERTNEPTNKHAWLQYLPAEVITIVHRVFAQHVDTF